MRNKPMFQISKLHLALVILVFFTSKLFAQDKDPHFKVIAFYSASWDAAHISFAHECNRWFPSMEEEHHFKYDSTNNWSNLNAEFLAPYQVVLFLDDQPPASQRAEFEQYMRNGGAWMGFHVCAFNTDASSWDWYYNQFLGMGAFKTNTWFPTAAILNVENLSHPSTLNLTDTFVSAVNEWYGWEVDLRTKENIDILCSINPESFPLGTDPNQSWYEGYYPVVWSNTDYKMMYLNMGHNNMNYSNNTDKSNTFTVEKQNQLVLDGLKWLASQNMPDPRVTRLNITSPENQALFLKPADIPISVNASDSDGVAYIEFFNGNELLYVDSVFPYFYEWKGIEIGKYTIKVRAIDSLNNAVSTSLSVEVEGEGAFNDRIPSIPGKIECENYDYGGEGISYHDIETSNQGGQYRTNEGVDLEVCSDTGGGFNIGYSTAGEWTKYTVNVTKTKAYTIQARVASASSNKKFHVELDGFDISGPITIPPTGGWQTWRTINIISSELKQGEQELKIIFDTEGINLNYIYFNDELISSTTLEKTGTSKIFPNPSQGLINIEFNQLNKMDTDIIVYNSFGIELKNIPTKINQSNNSIQLNLEAFPKGVYFIRLSNDIVEKVSLL